MLEGAETLLASAQGRENGLRTDMDGLRAELSTMQASERSSAVKGERLRSELAVTARVAEEKLEVEGLLQAVRVERDVAMEALSASEQGAEEARTQVLLLLLYSRYRSLKVLEP